MSIFGPFEHQIERVCTICHEPVNGGLIFVPPCGKRQHVIHGQCAIDYVQAVGIAEAKCPVCRVHFNSSEFTPEHLETLHNEETAEQMRIERAQNEHRDIIARVAEARVNQAGLDSDKVRAEVDARRALDERTFDIAMQDARLNGENGSLARSSSQGRNLLMAFNRVAENNRVPTRSPGTRAMERTLSL